MDTDPRRPGRWTDRAALPALWVAALAHTALLWNLCEDAYISFRYGRNLASGHGAVFNPGEVSPVEGYSNFLWVLLSAMVEGVGASSPRWVPGVSALLALVLVGAVYRTARHSLGVEVPAAFFGTLGMVALGTFGAWSTSGLETMAHTLLLFLALTQLVTASSTRGGLMAGVWGVGLLLVRTEGWAWAGLVGAVVLALRFREGRPVARVLAAYGLTILVVAVPYELWRGATYGSLVAATTQVKVHFGLSTLLRGVRQTTNLALTLLTPALVLPLAALAWTPRWRARAGAFAVLALAVPAYATLVGGDYMPFYRFHAAALGPFGVLLALGLHEVGARWGSHRVWQVGLGVALVGFLPSMNLHLVPAAVRVRVNFRGNTDQADLLSERERLDLERTSLATRYRKAAVLRPYVQPGDSYVWGAIGAFGYALPDLVLLDPFGLTNRQALEAGVTRDGARAGHDTRVDRDFFYDQRPTLLRFRAFDGRPPAERLHEWAEEIRALDPDALYAPELHVEAKETVVIARLHLDASARAGAWAAWEDAVTQRPRKHKQR